MKKTISLLLSLVMLISGVLAGAGNAYAGGWLDYIKNFKLDTWYNESFDYADYQNSSTKDYSDQFMFNVPQSGTVDIIIHCEPSTENDFYNNYLGGGNKLYIYKSSNTAESIFCENIGSDGFDDSKGYRYTMVSVRLSAGTYYLQYVYYRHNVGNLTGQYDIMLRYNPSFGNTSLSKVKGKKKAFGAKWNRAGGATGYQLQYAAKKNMKGAKTVKTISASKTVKKLKKKKKYYVRIRSYKTLKVNGVNKTYYGKWSAKKSVKTK